MKPALPTNTPIARPNGDDLNQAWKLVDQWLLHFYQLLFFNKPKLTSPGPNGHPFQMNFDPLHRHCLRVTHGDYNFLVTSTTTDEELLRKCQLILDAVATGEVKIDPMACCPLAKYRNCVCHVSFECPIHGEKCVGTHD